MEIKILQLLDGARHAEGLTVIIDVFRAFSTACYAFDRGAAAILPAGSLDESLSLARKFPGSLLMGERFERKPEGFDLGNSPTPLLTFDLNGKTLIHTTSSGTQGIVNAREAEEILTGSFVNAKAIVRYIKMKNPTTVSLVCMGYACEYPTDEDTFCAQYIRNELLGLPTNWETMVEVIRKGSGARFFEPSSQEWAPESDFDLCLRRNIFDFVLKAEPGNGYISLKKINV
jgi:2-phosphosulfolactate phosphatase